MKTYYPVIIAHSYQLISTNIHNIPIALRSEVIKRRIARLCTRAYQLEQALLDNNSTAPGMYNAREDDISSSSLLSHIR